MSENEISYVIRGVIFDVYNHFVPGLFESVYKEAMMSGLIQKGLSVEKEVGIHAEYLKQDSVPGFRADIVVENKVLIEIKSIEALGGVHKKQVRTYLKLSKHKLGLLVNFNWEDISKSIIIIANNL